MSEPNIPVIPPSFPPDQAKVLMAMKSAIELLMGHGRTPQDDRAARYRELTLTQNALTDAIASIPDVSPSGATPDPPTDLIITRGSWVHFLTWTNPTDAIVSHIEIWISTNTQSRSEAVLAGIVTVTEDLRGEPGAYSNPLGDVTADYTYWIRSVSYAGNHSSWEPPDDQGGYVVTGNDSVGDTIAAIIDILKGETPDIYSAATEYSFNDRCRTSDGRVWKYINIASSTGNEPPNSTYWERSGILMTGDVDGVPTVGIDGNLAVDGTILARHLQAHIITSDHIDTAEAFVGMTIQSSNFNSETKTGWQITSSGGSFFYNGAFTFGGGTSGYDNIDDKPTSLEDINPAEYGFIDGSVIAWFGDSAPALGVYPSSLWTTDYEKNIHLNDTYYDKTTKTSYVFTLTDTTYSWEVSTDLNSVMALASDAKDTADRKRRVFTSTPTVPYDEGDLWDTGSGIKRATNDRTSTQSFYEPEWVLVGDVTADNTASGINNQGALATEDAADFVTQVAGDRPHFFKVIAAGNSAGTTDVGLYDETETKLTSGARSYAVSAYRRSTGVWYHTTYDVFDNDANATSMASYLNSLGDYYIVVIFTKDEPQTNRLSNDLDEAIYNCGGSPAVFASSAFKYRGAYVLVGVPGIGMGNGIEMYAGRTDSSTTAKVETTFSIQNGNLQGGTSVTPDIVAATGWGSSSDETKIDGGKIYAGSEIQIGNADGTSDFCVMDSGEIEYWRYIGGYHRFARSLKSIEVGTAASGSTVTLSNYYRSQPSIIVSPKSIKTYSVDSTNEDYDQEISVQATNITETSSGSCLYSFVPVCTLNISGQVSSGSPGNTGSGSSSTSPLTVTSSTYSGFESGVRTVNAVVKVRGYQSYVVEDYYDAGRDATFYVNASITVKISVYYNGGWHDSSWSSAINSSSPNNYQTVNVSITSSSYDITQAKIVAYLTSTMHSSPSGTLYGDVIFSSYTAELTGYSSSVDNGIVNYIAIGE